MPPDAYTFPEAQDNNYYSPNPYAPINLQAGPIQTTTGIPPLCAWLWFIPDPTPNYGEVAIVSIYFNDPLKRSTSNVLFVNFDIAYISTLFGVSTARNSKIYFTDSTGAPLRVPTIGSGGASYNINL
jgi:hypothetical protein